MIYRWLGIYWSLSCDTNHPSRIFVTLKYGILSNISKWLCLDRWLLYSDNRKYLQLNGISIYNCKFLVLMTAKLITKPFLRTDPFLCSDENHFLLTASRNLDHKLKRNLLKNKRQKFDWTYLIFVKLWYSSVPEM